MSGNDWVILAIVLFSALGLGIWMLWMENKEDDDTKED